MPQWTTCVKNLLLLGVPLRRMAVQNVLGWVCVFVKGGGFSTNVDNGGLRERDVFAMWVRCGLGRKVSLVQLNEYGSTMDQNPVVNYYYSWVPSEGFFLHSNHNQNLKWLNLLSKQNMNSLHLFIACIFYFAKVVGSSNYSLRSWARYDGGWGSRGSFWVVLMGFLAKFFKSS